MQRAAAAVAAAEVVQPADPSRGRVEFSTFGTWGSRFTVGWMVAVGVWPGPEGRGCAWD